MSHEIFIAAPFGNYIRYRDAISVTGTWTLKPRGNRLKSVIKTLRYDRKERGWVNRLGLPNPGLEVGLEKTWATHVLSIAEISEDEFLIMENIIPINMSVELNLSCPNLTDHNVPKLLDNDSPKIFTASTMRDWCIAKVSPFISETELEHVIEKLNFKQIHFANTIPTKGGGLSGQSLKPYVSQLIRFVRSNWGNAITIIAGGGIKTKSDISMYMDEGANHVSLGTVCFNPIKLRKLLNSADRV